MAAKKDNELLIAGGILGLLLFGIYKLFFAKKEAKAATTGGDNGNAEPTPHGAIPGIVEGEPNPDTPGGTVTGGGTTGGNTPGNIGSGGSGEVYNGQISDPFPWMINPDIPQGTAVSGGGDPLAASTIKLGS